jgi:hypothetical protein
VNNWQQNKNTRDYGNQLWENIIAEYEQPSPAINPTRHTSRKNMAIVWTTSESWLDS